MVGPKKQKFWPRINILNRFFFKYVDELQSIKKCQNSTFKVNFLCQKSTDSFQKISFKNINLGDHFFVKTFFSRFNF